MATKRKATPDNDRLTDTNIARVIKLLNPAPESSEKAITKKVACDILGIAYNTTRLGTIISQYEERIARDKAKRAEKRGKRVTPEEIQYAIQTYIEGETIDAISKQLYRSPSMIRRLLEEYNVPLRQTSHSYFKPDLLPEDTVKDKFEIGEVVYSARYDSTAKIITELAVHPVYGKVYRVWLLAEDQQQFAVQPACELGSLEHIRKLGVQV